MAAVTLVRVPSTGVCTDRVVPHIYASQAKRRSRPLEGQVASTKEMTTIMNATRTTTLVALVLAAGFAVTGCSQTPAPIQTETPAAVQPDEPTEPVVEPTEEPALAVGDTVTNEGGSFVADLAATLPAGQRLVPVGGTLKYLVIDETQPLPAAYLDPILAEVAAGFGGEVADQFRTGHQVADTIESATGKTVVMYRGPGGDGAYAFYFVSGPLGDPTGAATKAVGATYMATPWTSFEAMVAMVTQVAAGNGYDTTRLVYLQITA